jgi:L-fucose isomerase-like protein
MRVGAIGARTTPFKTVRFDELALQKRGITVETYDLSDLFKRMASLSDDDTKVSAYRAKLGDYTRWTGVPDMALKSLARLGVALDALIREAELDAVAVRCWTEMQQVLGVSPCVVMSEMNERGVEAACEVDVGNAVTMRALRLASGRPAACLDWNNNYGDDEDKCILFHCGPVPQSLMSGKGLVTDHAIIANSVGKGCSWGCNTGRIAPTPFTFGSMLTLDGSVDFYLGHGEFTTDPIAPEFFGCAGVAKIENLQEALLKIGMAGHRHHVSVTPGQLAAPIREAFERYLGFNVMMV